MSTMLRSKKALRGRMMRCFLPDSLKIFLNPKSTMGSMYLRTFGKFFIICLRLIIAANIAKHCKRKPPRHPFRTIVHKIAKNLCVFVLSYRRLIRVDGDHGSSLGWVDQVRLKQVDLVRRVCGTTPWKVSAADQVRHRKVDLVRYGGITGERRSWRRRWGWTRLLPGAKECSGAPGRPGDEHVTG